jgi:hypothetical protein
MNYQCSLHSEIEAQVLAAALEEQHIPHQIQSFEDRAFDGIFQTQKGWGRVLASETHKNIISEILEDLRSGSLILSDDDI